MFKTKLMMLTTALLISPTVMAFTDSITLAISRAEVVRRYINDLGHANVQDMMTLFHNDATVISTSKGRMNAKEFFNAFLPEIVKSNTEMKELFSVPYDSNHLMARFHFSFKLKDGETGDGEYVDEFIFPYTSDKLSEVIMFENLKY